MSSELSAADRKELEALGRRVFEALARFHRGLVRLEIECFLVPPRVTPSTVWTPRLELALESDGALVRAGTWFLRCRRHDGQWQVAAVGRECQACRGGGACPRCAEAQTSGEPCPCLGSGFCTACLGLGRVIMF